MDDLTPSQALHTLAHRAGIASQYAGFWGADVTVPDATLRAALQAMGIAAQTDADVLQALQTGAVPTATPVVPPVLVVNQGQVGRVTVLAPAPAQWALQDENGVSHQGTCVPDGEAVHITLPADLHPGYYRLRVTVGAQDCADDCTVIVTPAQCWVPAPLKNGDRWWGPCVQLYAIRSARNWGIGDLGDLRELVGTMAALGASFVGLNPLHALFAQQPEVASPYSPSSRDALNALYIDVQSLVDSSDHSELRLHVNSLAFQHRLAALRAAGMVDYAGVAAVKTEVLGALWQHFRSTHLAQGTDSAHVFHTFVQTQGAALRQHALFEALQAQFAAADPAVWGWPVWPEAYRDIRGAAVAQFAQVHAERVDYHLWLQWLADQQLAAAQAHARALGMGLGLYRDLAVGVNEGGSDTWTQPQMYALGMHVGAPPDPLSAMGQNWGLPPLNPVQLQAGRYQPFIDTLRANMRHAGALRLDHVMGLMRLFWLPPQHVGNGAGTYASYPLDALLGILALESTRHQCLVIGEDLGNVAPAMRQAMHARALLSYRPLFFERDNDAALRAPGDWQPQALAVVSTHDLPTLRGFWRGEDLAVLSGLQLFPDATAHDQQVQARANDRDLLVQALEHEGLLPPDFTTATQPLPDDIHSGFVDAVYSFIARTPCWLVGVQLEDVALQRLQVNVPGTTEDMFPNWRRKVAVPVEDLGTDPRMRTLAAALHAARTTPPHARLKILFATPECAPWVKTGGLGDVSAALPQALGALGHDVKVLMPAYPGLAARAPLPPVRRVIDIPAVGVWPAARLLCGTPVDGSTLVLLDCPELYDRTGGPYVDAAGHDHADNARRFAFLAHVAAWLGSPDSPWPGWQADVVHGNDWQCGLAPLYLAQAAAASHASGTTRRHAASVLTIHNLAFQGVFPMGTADSIAVQPAWRTVQGAEYWGQLSMLKAGLQCADAITTVSPTYAREIQQSALGFGMDGVLRDKASRLHGILNGIDTTVWNPQHDPLIPHPFHTEALDGKRRNKAALQQRCGLAVAPHAMLFGLVGRLTWQKGIDLVVDLVPWLLAQGCQLVVLGQGEPGLQAALLAAAAQRPDAVAVHVDFDETLAHHIEAGVDCFLMPSRFEPCGLNQMYSQRYGTPPVVHATGGLVDSVVDVHVGTDGVAGTGFVMPEPTVPALQDALQRALELFAQPEEWRRVQAQGMARDFGWAGSARAYEAVYRSILAAR